ncbi:MAG TPA: thermonuclease family protein [Asticcacaulis sp.]|nr:thermonuclease family protein [Asticcacaulis sp.]
MAVTVCAVVCLLAGSAEARTIAGQAHASDGDNLVIKGVRIRLYGVDAFEYDQTCGRFACGQTARRTLAELVRGQDVACVQHDIDRYGRMVSVCKLRDGRDLGGEMVGRGLAVAYRRFSLDYLPQERAAQTARAGAWAYGFQAPLDYRKSHPRQ